ncbi:MAG: M24 family metallopeptidase [Candidatus Promineifilaceae bacterium]
MNTFTFAPRGFSLSEFEQRTARAQQMMHEAEIDALLLTTEPNFRYFTGFQSQFWQSPTRPWFTIVPLTGKPIAVVPEIGRIGIECTWVEDIRTWPSPRPEDDGVTLLADTLASITGRFGRVGALLGPESYLRMPAANFATLRQLLGAVEVVDASRMMTALRMVKSADEIAKIETMCQIASDGFENLPNLLSMGVSERENTGRFRLDLLQRGGDSAPYLMASSGSGGYDNIIMGPSDRILTAGDIMVIDTGTVYDGYFCDFDRNFAFGHADDTARRAYDVLYRATDAGIAAAKPGATTSDLCNAMWAILEAGGALGNDVGRMGHGLGMQLTEQPSITPTDGTVLLPGMVMTIEPAMTFAPNKQMVHEENIVITEDGARLLTRRAPIEIPIVS